MVQCEQDKVPLLMKLMFLVEEREKTQVQSFVKTLKEAVIMRASVSFWCIVKSKGWIKIDMYEDNYKYQKNIGTYFAFNF